LATKTASAGETSALFTDKQRKIALIIVAIGFIMDLLDSTIVNIAIPSIRSNIHASYSAIQWVFAGYTLAFSVLLIIGGRMGDIFGYKKLFMIGVAGFSIASLLSGVAQDPTMLIIARVIQGTMAAMMVPQVLSLMQVMYKPEERGAINGLFGGLGGAAASLGPVIGGLLLKANIFNLDWRPLFLINVPIGVIGFFAAIKYLPDGKSDHPLKLDLFGTGLIIIALFLLVFPLIQGRDAGWPAWTYIMMGLSVPLLIGFAFWQVHKEKTDGSPLVMPSLFKHRSFGIGLAINLVFEMAMIGFFFLFTLLIQIGFGYTPIHAALTGLPIAIGIAFTMALLGEKVVPKLGRYSLSIGSLFMAGGLLSIGIIEKHYNSTIHSWQFTPSLLVIGIGMGLVFGALFAAVLNNVEPAHAGSASGIMNALQQVGGAIGIALIGVIFFGQISSGANFSFSQVEPNIRTALSAQHVPASSQGAIITSFKQCYKDRTTEKDSDVTPKSCKNENGTESKQISNVLAKSAKQANAINFAKAFKTSSYFMVGLALLSFVLTFALPAHFRPEAFKEA
jgi:EmrB/QacA subfamily drug resistance transporter